MKPIDFTKYPSILKYVKKHIDKSYFKPSPYSVLNEDTFISIVEEWITSYEKNIDIIVKNTLLIYSLTNEETGYEVLAKDWERWKPFFKEKRMTEELVRTWWEDNFVACISHLYQSLVHDYDKDITGGATGCLITCSFTVHFVDSEYKGVKKIAVTDFGMYLNIGNSLHTEIDIVEN